MFFAALLMAANCSAGPCVQVYTDPLTHQVIISANQNSGGKVSHTAPKPKPAAPKAPAPKPRAKQVARTPPVIKKTTWVPYKPTPIIHRAYKAPPKKKVNPIKKVVTTAISLSDQISRLLPGGTIHYQPPTSALTGVPVYLWSDTNPLFNIATTILGIGVTVAMKPSFVWDFGDGSSITTSDAGGPYPDGKITHSYKKSGIYTINLTTSWAGSWAAQGAVLPVLGGAIVQNATATIQINPAPTDFTR